MKPVASTIVTFGIPAIAALNALLFAAAVAWAPPPGSRLSRFAAALGGAAVWMGITGASAAAGWLSDFSRRPPLLMIVFALTLALGLAVGLSPLGRRLTHLPLAVLVGVQAFRLPLELVMHRAAREGVMPAVLSFSGYNYDIVTGIVATILPPLLLWGKSFGRAPIVIVHLWNAWGLLCLGFIVLIAVGSSPFVRAFGDAPEQLNTWVAYFPFSWIAISVAFALAGHIVITRKLGAEARATTTS